MPKKYWTKESAEMEISDYRGENKIIYIDGTMSLKKCSALDFLVNHCGYICREKETKTNE